MKAALAFLAIMASLVAIGNSIETDAQTISTSFALAKGAPVTFSTSEFVTVPGAGATAAVQIDINGSGPSPSATLTNSSQYRIECVIWRGTEAVTLGYTGGALGQSTIGQFDGTVRLEPGEALYPNAIMRTASSTLIPNVELLLISDTLSSGVAEGYLFVSGTVR